MADGKVVLIKRTINNIEPPDGWLVSTPFGHLSIDGTKAGRLARLGDVLKWLEGTREWSRERALMALLDGLPADAMDHVYRVQPGRDACLVPTDDRFGYWSDQQLEDDKQRHAANEAMRINTLGLRDSWATASHYNQSVPVSGPGMPALRKRLQDWRKATIRLSGAAVCTTTVARNDWSANYLAVPLRKAFEWWGYGSMEKASDTKEERQDTKPTSEWNDARIVARHAELKKDKQGKFTQRLANESGWSDRDIRRVVKAAKDAGVLGKMAGSLVSQPAKKRR